MAEAMFGAPIGLSQRLRDSNQTAQVGGQLLETGGKLAAIPSEIALRESQARLHTATAEEKERERRQAEALLLISGGPKEGEALPAYLERLGSTALDIGDFKRGRELIGAGGLARNRQATTEFRNSQVEQHQHQQRMGLAKRLGEIAGSVRPGDQASYDRARELFAQVGGDVSDLPPDVASGEAIMRQAAAASMNEYQRSRVAQDGIRNTMAEITEKRRREAFEAGKPLRDARTAAALAEVERKKKAGGAVVGSPSKADVLGARAALKEAGIVLSDEDLKVAPRDIAARAKALVRQNPGIDIARATKEAINEAVRDGSLPEIEGAWAKYAPGAANRKYLGTGRTPASAVINVPLDEKGLPVESKLIPGRYYLTPKGGPRRWNGKGWDPTSGTAADFSDGGDDDDEDDE